MRHLILIFLLFSGVSFGKGKQAEPAKPHPATIAQRLSYILTGKRASAEQIQSYVSGKKSLSDLAEDMRANQRADLEDRLAQFWLQRLEINDPIEFLNIYDPNYFNNDLRKFVYDRWNPAAQKAAIQKETGGSELATVRARMRPHVCPGLAATDPCPALNDIKGVWRFDLQLPDDHPEKTIIVCPMNTTKAINPWWNLNSVIAACQYMDKPEYCGPNLQRCFPGIVDVYFYNYATDHSVYRININEVLTKEPGLIAAKVILEDKDWREVLTTKKGIVNTSLDYYLQRRDFSARLLGVMPPNSYPDTPRLVANKVESVNIDQAQHRPFWEKINDPATYWVEKGEHHAGVLTTAAFHLTATSPRQKANRIRQAFECQEFVFPDAVPDAAVEDPNPISNPNCKGCHQTLEPLSAFLYRWPAPNVLNYRYNRLETVNANGSYNGQSGSDTVGLGAIMSETKAYSQCAVRRAFEFVAMRSMNTQEELNLLPALTKKFISGGRRVWPIMLDIINSPAFNGTIQEKVSTP